MTWLSLCRKKELLLFEQIDNSTETKQGDHLNILSVMSCSVLETHTLIRPNIHSGQNGLYSFVHLNQFYNCGNFDKPVFINSSTNQLCLYLLWVMYTDIVILMFLVHFHHNWARHLIWDIFEWLNKSSCSKLDHWVVPGSWFSCRVDQWKQSSDSSVLIYQVNTKWGNLGIVWHEWCLYILQCGNNIMGQIWQKCSQYHSVETKYYSSPFL